MMSIIKKDKCDFCGREVDNCFNVKGWVRIRGLDQITIVKGIGDDTYYKRFLGKDTLLDFCCWEHFVGFVKKIRKEAEVSFLKNEI